MSADSKQAGNGLPLPAIVGLIVVGFIIFVVIGVTVVIRGPLKDDGTAETRIEPVARIEIAGGSGAAAGGRSGEELYNAACSACHGSGVLGAPKAHDAGAWSARLGGNVKALVASATKGKGNMPAKGGVADATEEELTRAVQFMMK